MASGLRKVALVPLRPLLETTYMASFEQQQVSRSSSHNLVNVRIINPEVAVETHKCYVARCKAHIHERARFRAQT